MFCYHLIIPRHMAGGLIINNVTAVAMAVTMLGMLLFITHNQAVAYLIGFMTMENGIFFAGLVAAHGMPMVVELGIIFDVLVAVVLFGLFFFHIVSSIDSLDVDRLNLLRENVE
jgi:hydrogenase-4 component E